MTKPLYIPGKFKKGTKARVFCNSCKTVVFDICKSTGKSIKSCPHPNKHTFKVILHVKGSTNKRKTYTLQTRDLNTALKEALDLEDEHKSNAVPPERRSKPLKEPNNPIFLHHCLARYIGFISGDPEIAPAYNRKRRSTKHIKDVERCFKEFIDSLRQHNIDYSNLTIDSIDKHMVGSFHEYLLETKKVSPRTYNKYFGYLRTFMDYLIKDEGYEISNPFKSVRGMEIQREIKTITEEEYNALLTIVKNEKLGLQELSTGEIKDHYKPYLGTGIELGLETGRRLGEIKNLKFSSIKKDTNDQLMHIEVEDYKVNNQRGPNRAKKQIYIPITASLNSLLMRLGYEKYKDTDKYLIAPEDQVTRDTIAHNLSRGFSHYYKH